MGLREQTECYFGMRVRTERDRRGWSQEELARRLTEKGIPVYASTIAKIESEKKPRSVRLAEASAIADVFEVSLDRLLGRTAGARQDVAFTARALLDASRHGAFQVASIEATVRERIAELRAFGFSERGAREGDTMVERCESAVDALIRASEALANVRRFPEEGEGLFKNASLDLLIDEMISDLPLEGEGE